MPDANAIGPRLRAVAATYRSAIDRGLRQRGLTLSQYQVLAAIGEDGLASNADLARAMSITPQSAHELLLVLVGRELVERPEGAGPGRAGVICLTRAGRRALASADARVAAIDARITDTLGEGPARRFLEMLALAESALER